MGNVISLHWNWLFHHFHPFKKTGCLVDSRYLGFDHLAPFLEASDFPLVSIWLFRTQTQTMKKVQTSNKHKHGTWKTSFEFKMIATLFWKVVVQNGSNSVDFLYLDDSRIFQVSEELGEGALTYCWWIRNPVKSPVEVGSLSQDFQGFIHPRWLG